MMHDKQSKLFNRLTKWSDSIPIGDYRYTGHKTIYESTTGEFKPSERQIMVHRYADRYLSGKYVRFHIKYLDSGFKVVKSSCWQYAAILSVHHGNDNSKYGYLHFHCIIANTMSHETIIIKPNTELVCEVISTTWFEELVKMVRINN